MYFEICQNILPCPQEAAYRQHVILQAHKSYPQQLATPFFPEAGQILLNNKKQFWSY